ncbi:GTP-binding protein [Metabacillus litoralis]|uniref:GTP-binding protein n=1 Tax=Metabacillus litoralis TaxID=152268 RepID=A0A5C6VKW4_9BACI|nr:GTP-binding protein [Metabacillus litoralis]
MSKCIIYVYNRNDSYLIPIMKSEGFVLKLPINVYIISGFLGSGKTTVLKKLVEECNTRGQKLGIILNELGDTNVENHLFDKEQMYELLNGCICCSIQEDLKTTLDQFVKNPVDILLIEGTGVANPNEIIEALSSPLYIDQFNLQSVISLVDASNYLDYQSIFSSSKEVRTLLKEQITSASFIILNKTDLVSEKKLDKIHTQIKKLVHEEIPIVSASYGDVSVAELLTERVRTINLTDKQVSACGCSVDSSCSHDHVNHAAIKAVKLEDIPLFDKKVFEKWLKGLPENVFRGKGIVQFHKDSNLYSFQYASKKLALEEVKSKNGLKPIIILIGNGINSDAIKESYEQTFLHLT